MDEWTHHKIRHCQFFSTLILPQSYDYIYSLILQVCLQASGLCLYLFPDFISLPSGIKCITQASFTGSQHNVQCYLSLFADRTFKVSLQHHIRCPQRGHLQLHYNLALAIKHLGFPTTSQTSILHIITALKTTNQKAAIRLNSQFSFHW